MKMKTEISHIGQALRYIKNQKKEKEFNQMIVFINIALLIVSSFFIGLTLEKLRYQTLLNSVCQAYSQAIKVSIEEAKIIKEAGITNPTAISDSSDCGFDYYSLYNQSNAI